MEIQSPVFELLLGRAAAPGKKSISRKLPSKVHIFLSKMAPRWSGNAFPREHWMVRSPLWGRCEREINIFRLWGRPLVHGSYDDSRVALCLQDRGPADIEGPLSRALSHCLPVRVVRVVLQPGVGIRISCGVDKEESVN